MRNRRMPKKIKSKYVLGLRERQRLKYLWTAEKVEVLSTEEIVEKLRTFGVVVVDEVFKSAAQKHRSGWDLAEDFDPGLHGNDFDFLALAVCCLWARWLPQRPSLEMIDDFILDGYEHADAHTHDEGLAVWRRAWDALRELFDDSMTTIEKAQKAVFTDYSSLLNWTEDYAQEHVHVSPHYLDDGIRYIDELLAQFKDGDDLFRQNILADKADIYTFADRFDDAADVARAIIQTWPTNAIGYTTLASILQKQTRTIEAIEVLQRALDLTVVDADEFDVRERIKELRG